MRQAADDDPGQLVAANQHKVEFLRNVRQELRWPVDEVTSAAIRAPRRRPRHPRTSRREYARDIAGAGEPAVVAHHRHPRPGHPRVGRHDRRARRRRRARRAPRRRWTSYVGRGRPAGVHLEVEVDAEPAPRVWVDRDKLRRAVAGLVSNAVKFTPGRRAGRRARRASTTDTGHLGRRHRPRYPRGGPGPHLRGASSRAARPWSRPGVGVGLTLARRFVELQGGRVELASAAGRRAARFTITLPVFERPASALRGGAGSLKG